MFDLLKAQQGALFLQLCPVVLQFPFPISTSDVSFLVRFLPNGVWAVICHVPLSVTKMRWQRPWGHQPPRYLNHQHLCLHNGRFGEKSRGMDESYIRPGNTRKNSSQRSCNQRGRAALIMTIPWEDNLHYISGGRQPLKEEEAAVNAAEYTRLMLLEGLGEEGLWLPVQAARRTSHRIAQSMHAGQWRL